MITLQFESALWEKNISDIAGIDEAGRGPLAGPVVAAAVIFPRNMFLHGVNDSKKLSEKKREELFPLIAKAARCFGIGIVEHAEIDAMNILNATFAAMQRAIDALRIRPQHLLIDGNRFNRTEIPYTTIIGGDAQCFSVAAASILAKVTRDKFMKEMNAKFPLYNFAQHKGYPTKAHIEAIRKYGICEIHRKSFIVKKFLPHQSDFAR